MERLLTVSKELSRKVESNESAASELLKQCESLQQELKAMRQYRSAIKDLNSDEQGHTRLPHIEFSYIKQLQRDNSELRTLLEEHQAALEMIMLKYRKQVSTFMHANSFEPSNDHLAEELQLRTDQVYNMAAVMYKAAKAEDSTLTEMTERVSKLEYENRHLRELLEVTTPSLPDAPPLNTSTAEDKKRTSVFSTNATSLAAMGPRGNADLGSGASNSLATWKEEMAAHRLGRLSRGPKSLAASSSDDGIKANSSHTIGNCIDGGDGGGGGHLTTDSLGAGGGTSSDSNCPTPRPPSHTDPLTVLQAVEEKLTKNISR